MKTFLMSLLLAAAPPSFSTTMAWACDRGDAAKKRVVITEDAKKKVANVEKVMVTSGDKGGKAYTVTIGASSKDGRSDPKAMRVGEAGNAYWVSENDPGLVWVGEGPAGEIKAKIKTKVKADVKAGAKDKAGRTAWLGVSIDPVPEALASQFGLDGKGVIVVNVVGDSPADRAGFQAYDVILTINGETVEGEVGQAVDLIKSHEPGEDVDIVILRSGDKKPIRAKLGSLAEIEADKLEFKFEGSPLADVEEQIMTRGKILRKGPEGKWIMEDLGDLRGLKELPKHIEMLMPKSGRRSTQVHMSAGEKKITTRVQRDGSTLMISGKGGGPIEVTRVDENGDETEVAYKDEDELRKEDEEAYGVWEEAGESAVVHLNLDSIEVPDVDIPDIDIEIPEMTFEVDPGQREEHAEVWKEHMEKSLGEAKKSYDRAMEEYQKAVKQWRGGKDVKVPDWPNSFFFDEGKAPSPWGSYSQLLGKPKHTFEVQTDGTIEVRIRKGDSELVQLYQGEDDLAQRSPKLFKKYKKLMGLENE